MRIALYEPDIPQNTGNILRLGACLGLNIDIIEMFLTLTALTPIIGFSLLHFNGIR
jgi:hypothetical protein|tara:strand:+ start:123 stop:290 length:168 start_codon:yes stop_codon:yes gene_type:complete